MFRILICFLLLGILPDNGRAQEGVSYREIRRAQRRCDVFDRCHVHYYVIRQPIYRDNVVYRPYAQNEGYTCLELKRAVGDERQSEDRARESALLSVQSAIRWYHGEMFMDPENMRDVRFRCGKSSIADTVSGKVGEALRGHLWRCEVEARPCRAPHRMER